MNTICPICGYPELHEHYDTIQQICPSCSFQFECTDMDLGYTYEQWRALWIAQGMLWDEGNSVPPADWDPRAQLRNIGVDPYQ